MRNFFLLEISDYYLITFLVLFVPVDTENQAIAHSMQFKSLQFIMYISLIILNMIPFLLTVSSSLSGSGMPDQGFPGDDSH